MRTPNHDWIDTNTMTPLYSFQVHADGKWRHPHIDGKPLLFKTTAERDKARAEARARKANSHGAGVSE